MTFLLLAASPAVAACLSCDEVVEFDRRRAECFQKDYEAFLKAAEESRTKNAEIDLSACVGEGSDERRGLDKFPDALPRSAAAETRVEPLRSVFLLDTGSIVCLKRLVDENWGKLDPKLQFDLLQQCNR